MWRCAHTVSYCTMLVVGGGASSLCRNRVTAGLQWLFTTARVRELLTRDYPKDLSRSEDSGLKLQGIDT